MMTISEIQSYIEAIEINSSLYDDKCFDNRVEVVDFIDFHILDRLQEFTRKTGGSEQVIALKVRAEKIKSSLEEIDTNLFEKLRAGIRAAENNRKQFSDLVNEYTDDHFLNSGENSEEPGYDNLDIFINGLINLEHMPEQTKELEPGMVYYQKTPARIVFDLIKKSQYRKKDVFIDIGSGLGQVIILVNLLTGMTAKGIEFEPSFCDFARNCAARLNLSNISFLPVDARKADYSQGNIFFMFTPFTGEILQEVLEILRKEALLRKIKIITYGPCTTQVALQEWLILLTPKTVDLYEPVVFISIKN